MRGAGVRRATRRPRARIALAGALLALCGATSGAAGCRTDAVELRGLSGQPVRFSVEVADDAQERARGLMHRPELPMSSGMLFVYEAPVRATFWMKNTLIPLDMIFADAAGRVVGVHAMAVPGDETTIDGGPDIFAVLEINGGLAERLGIAPGSVMRHPVFAPEAAAWPCG